MLLADNYRKPLFTNHFWPADFDPHFLFLIPHFILRCPSFYSFHKIFHSFFCWPQAFITEFKLPFMTFGLL